MSTSILYHGFGIYGYRYTRTEYQQGALVFSIEKDPTSLRCPCCKGIQVIRKGTVLRWFHTLPIGSKQVYLKLQVPRVMCRTCGIVRQITLGFADARRTYTMAFQRYVVELSKRMTIRDVARHLGIGWDTVKEVLRTYLSSRFSRPDLKHLDLIAIDEIAIGKGHRYLTVVLDLLSGAVVFVGDGKGADSLAPFWKRLKRARAKIRAVAIDMSPAYISAVSTNLPEAVIVFDHFHLVKLFNDKLSKLHRELQRQAETAGKKVLKGTRWLLLKKPERLSPDHNEQQRLEEALRLNSSLATAYYLKEDLRQFWQYPDKPAVRTFLDDWIARARASGVTMLHKLAQTLDGHREGILAYFDFPISTGPLERTNNKIDGFVKTPF